MKYTMILSSGFMAMALISGSALAEEVVEDVVVDSEQVPARTEAQERLNMNDEGVQTREQVRTRSEDGEQTQASSEDGEGVKNMKQYQYRNKHQTGSRAAGAGSRARR